jgi:hypothetical protein
MTGIPSISQEKSLPFFEGQCDIAVVFLRSDRLGICAI